MRNIAVTESEATYGRERRETFRGAALTGKESCGMVGAPRIARSP